MPRSIIVPQVNPGMPGFSITLPLPTKRNGFNHDQVMGLPLCHGLNMATFSRLEDRLSFFFKNAGNHTDVRKGLIQCRDFLRTSALV